MSKSNYQKGKEAIEEAKKSESQKTLSLVNPVFAEAVEKMEANIQANEEAKGIESKMENTIETELTNETKKTDENALRDKLEAEFLLQLDEFEKTEAEVNSAKNLEAIHILLNPSEAVEAVKKTFAEVLVANRAGRATNKTFFNTVEFYKKWKLLVNQIRVNLADYAIQNYNGVDTGAVMPEEVEATFVNQFFTDYKEVLLILSHSVNANLHAKKADFFALYPFSVKAERSGKGTQRDVKPNGELSFRLSLENFLADRITESVAMPASMIEAQKAARKAVKVAKKAVETAAKKAEATILCNAKKAQKDEEKRLDTEAKASAKSEQVAS